MHIIPKSVLNLNVMIEKQKSAGRIYVVVIIEQRNITEILLQESLMVKNVIFVMTADFSDSGTRDSCICCQQMRESDMFRFYTLKIMIFLTFSFSQCLKHDSRVSI